MPLLPLWALVLLCLPFTPIRAQESATIIHLGTMEEGELLGRQLTYVDDPSGNWTLTDILAQEASIPFRKGQQDVLNLGFSKATVWIRLVLDNPDAVPRPLYLEYGYPVIDHLTLYYETGSAWQERRAGDTNQEPQIDIAENRNPSFAINVPPGSSRIFIKIKGDGALQAPIKLWTKDGLQTHMMREYALLALIYGVFGVMVFYNFLLCVWFRSPAYLYYVVFIAASILNFMNLQGFTQILFPRPISVFLCSKLALIANSGVTLCLGFSRYFLDLRSSSVRMDRWFRWLTLISLLSMAVSLVSYNIGIKMFMLQTFVVSFSLLAVGVYRSVQGYRPAYFFTLSWTFILTGHIVYQSAVLGVIPFNFVITFSAFIGSAVEIVLISLALGDKMRFEQQTARREIAQLYNDVKVRNEEISSLNQHLEKLVEDKTRNIRSILKHIRQGIFMIGADRKVMADTSDYLLDIFDESKVEERDAFELLFQTSGMPSDQVNQVEMALAASFGEPLIAFDLNEHLLCQEWTRVNRRGETRILECDWNPMTKDGVIDKILVTVKDVTEHRVLEQKNKEQEEVLKIIGEIISIDAGTFRRFTQQSERLLAECRELCLGAPARDERLLRRIFVNLHTLKGTARSLFLSEIAEGVHQLEQKLQHAIDDAAAYAKLDLADGLQEIKTLLERYVRIAQEKLGMNQTDVLHMTKSEIGSLLGRMEEICAHAVVQPRELAGLLSEQQRLFYKHLYRELPEFCATLRSTVSSVARELGKMTPELVIRSDEGLVLTTEGEDLLTHIFVHILRNAVDHGIEAKETRVSQGKPVQGRIDIAFHALPDALIIEVADDGQGVNLKELTERAIKMGLVDEGRRIPEQECADLIFIPGFSTREQVSLVSGRGVGMDAVKTYVEEKGGQIKLILSPRKHPLAEGRYFALSLQLPRTFMRILQPLATRLAS